MKVLDLFSGIGGFSLGLESTGGFQTAQFVEINPFCQKILAKHWPDVPIHDDIKSFKSARQAYNVITGGFPCQDISISGKKAGIYGERSGLWWDMRRLIAYTEPEYVIIENVSNLRSNGLEQVLTSLWEIGYDSEWHCIPATYVGAWHKRDRIWILAYPNVERSQRYREEPILRQSHLSVQLQRGFEEWPGRRNLPLSTVHHCTDGVSERLAALGNSIVPQIAEVIGYAILEDKYGIKQVPKSGCSTSHLPT